MSKSTKYHGNLKALYTLSSCGPIMWLIIINKLLERIVDEEEFHIIMFADDIMVILKASASFHFKELAKKKNDWYFTRLGKEI